MRPIAQLPSRRYGGYADRAIFSELSPRPHDTGMATLIGQSPNQFELHLRAILGLPIPAIQPVDGGAATAVILASEESDRFTFDGVEDALACGGSGTPVDVRLFGKPTTRPNRRMGVVLARAKSAEAARALKPLFERVMFGRHIFLYENADRELLKPLGELHTPSVADLFVATMKGGDS